VHGYGEGQVQGGASGAIVIDGVESNVPALRGLPERTLILRDQLLPGGKPVRSNVGVSLFDRVKRATQKATGPNAKPSWDVSLNHIPITYPAYTPAVIRTRPREKQFWRVLNAAADTIFDLQLLVNGTLQPLDVVAVDGVPLGRSLTQQSIPLSPGGRVEFIVVTPGEDDKAQLITQNWESGPDGEVDPNVHWQTSFSVKTLRKRAGCVGRRQQRSTHGHNPCSKRLLCSNANCISRNKEAMKALQALPFF
jgi:FtsP/CotA-like multicopper oxidase with cupredoxin domain